MIGKSQNSGPYTDILIFDIYFILLALFWALALFWLYSCSVNKMSICIILYYVIKNLFKGFKIFLLRRLEPEFKKLWLWCFLDIYGSVLAVSSMAHRPGQNRSGQNPPGQNPPVKIPPNLNPNTYPNPNPDPNPNPSAIALTLTLTLTVTLG